MALSILASPPADVRMTQSDHHFGVRVARPGTDNSDPSTKLKYQVHELGTSANRVSQALAVCRRKSTPGVTSENFRPICLMVGTLKLRTTRYDMLYLANLAHSPELRTIGAPSRRPQTARSSALWRFQHARVAQPQSMASQ